MATDIQLNWEGGEHVSAESNTDEGLEFIDSWTGAMLAVVDSGRITIPVDVVEEFTAAAEKDGLKVEASE